VPDGAAMLGSVLAGRYHVRQLLGSGGVGHVYLAEVLSTDDVRARVALKVLRAEHRATPALVARFEREALAAARVVHPSVLRLGEIALDGDPHPFFTMELLVGLDLADTLGYSTQLSPVRAVRIGRALADALEAAHTAGVIHRDVKPENVFLVHAADGGEPVKLLDFGFACLCDDDADRPPERTRRPVVGTPEYMAPEQATGAAAAPSADVYSLGVVLYEMLTGRVPFRGDSFAAVARQHLEAPVPPLERVCPTVSISPELRAVVAAALEKEPARRLTTHALSAALAATPEARRAPR
jgi:serine/threonine-protein kinase